MKNPVGQEKQFEFVRVMGTTERLMNLKEEGRKGRREGGRERGCLGRITHRVLWKYKSTTQGNG